MSLSSDNNLTERRRFADDGKTPNHPRFAMLVHRGAFDASVSDPASVVERLFGANGWGGFWRNGVYPFHHYHSTCHEALGVARGWAKVQFGGENGEIVRVAAGDVAVLPAGTGHKRIDASDDFLVVGSYPPDQPYDMIRSGEGGHAEAAARIATVPIAPTDPVFGTEGGLRDAWKD